MFPALANTLLRSSMRWVDVVKQVLESRSWMRVESLENFIYLKKWLREARSGRLQPQAILKRFKREEVAIDESLLWDKEVQMGGPKNINNK